MTESQFIHENKAKWEELEDAIQSTSIDPDVASNLFRKVSGDLSYAQTHFPRRRVRLYLNGLVGKIFDIMRTKPKVNIFKSFFRFYTEVLPTEVIRSRKQLLIAFVLFVTCMGIGAITTIQQPEFAREFLGPDYIDMTDKNIASGDPMAVYKSSPRAGMFLGITVNNVMIAFRCFVSGLLAGVATVFLLIYNGVMVGVFQAMFYPKGLLLTSFLTIWLHGTFEISAIIIAGGAGLILGSSLLFPGTFTRIQSLKLGASRSLTIILSTLPLFIIAGFIEGFITRLTSMPTAVKVGIIGFSALIILLLYVILPYRFWRSGKYFEARDLNINALSNPVSINSDDGFFTKTFAVFSIHLDSYFKYFFLPIMTIVLIVFYYVVNNHDMLIGMESLFKYKDGGLWLGLFWVGIFTYFFCIMHLIIKERQIELKKIISYLSHYFLSYILCSIITVLPFYFINETWMYLVYLAFPLGMVFMTNHFLNPEKSQISALSMSISTSFRFWIWLILIGFIVFCLYGVANSLVSTIFGMGFGDVISWHNIFEFQVQSNAYLFKILEAILVFSLFPIFYLMVHFQIVNKTRLQDSWDIEEKLSLLSSSASKLA